MITMLYAGLCALLVIVLALRVVQSRTRARVGIGHGGDEALERRVRVHANAIENLPIALILLGGVELNGFPDVLVHIFGATLLISRLAHAWGLSKTSGRSYGRFVGTVGTWLVMLVMALMAIVAYVSGITPLE